MSENLKIKITDDMKQAMRARNEHLLSTIRLLLANIKQLEIDTQTSLTDEEIVSLIQKMIKQRQEAITQYKKANRAELADKEEQEIRILSDYLPPQLSEHEITQLITQSLEATGATTIKEMGKVMNDLKKRLQGRADIGNVSRQVKERLSQ